MHAWIATASISEAHKLSIEQLLRKEILEDWFGAINIFSFRLCKSFKLQASIFGIVYEFSFHHISFLPTKPHGASSSTNTYKESKNCANYTQGLKIYRIFTHYRKSLQVKGDGQTKIYSHTQPRRHIQQAPTVYEKDRMHHKQTPENTIEV